MARLQPQARRTPAADAIAWAIVAALLLIALAAFAGGMRWI